MYYMTGGAYAPNATCMATPVLPDLVPSLSSNSSKSICFRLFWIAVQPFAGPGVG